MSKKATMSKKLTAEEEAEIKKRIAEGGSATLTAAEIRQKIAEGGGFLLGFKHNPNYDYANDSDDELLPDDALPEHRPEFNPIWSRHNNQTAQSDGFELYDYPGLSMLTGATPVNRYNTETFEVELMKKLANRAIEEYNEKECNVFKYKFLTIETANYRLTGYVEFFMTIKVLNLTLGTPIETFQVHGAKRCGDGFEKIILCRPKKEYNS